MNTEEKKEELERLREENAALHRTLSNLKEKVGALNNELTLAMQATGTHAFMKEHRKQAMNNAWSGIAQSCEHPKRIVQQYYNDLAEDAGNEP